MSSTPPSAGARHRAVVLMVILGCQLMMTLDASIVTTALTHIKTELGFTDSSLSWIQNAYVLAFGGLLLLGARAGDLLGRRRVFIAGTALFTAASLLAGLAPSAGLLIAARTLQGLASAFAIPSTLALLITSFPEPEERTRAIAIYSAVIGAGASVGIIVGGVFTEYLSWRWGLLINVPLGILILALSPRYLPETEARPGQVDILGALSVTVGMSALVYGLVEAAEIGWGSARTLLPLAGSVALLVAFVLIELRATQPIVPIRLFLSVQRSGAYVGRILIVGAMFSTFYFLSQYLQNVRGLSPLATGLAYIPMTGMFFAMVYAVRWAGPRVSKPALLLVSLVTAGIGMAWLSRIDATTSVAWILPPLLVLGIGQGIAIILLTDLGMAEVDPGDAGAASGLVNTAHQIGGSIGLALLTVVYGSAVHHDPAPDTITQAHGYSTVFDVATGFYALAVIVALVILVAHRRRASRSITPVTVAAAG
ncbi:drug resistance transporter, EmrB/QacA subfamily [Nocardioides sp. YR527]|uniref:MFS transporter n=1 Tax=Nocardioides sp. YR527 TaxID=1881028 RepID=UPI00088A41BA|nr:MFS transporter [Nocardioides sp. YR527]SDJ83200.1 drug resistance transporter, EmrB/QacA subfamily [Nocardioides sp. YR527]